jgi:hypothetical protein
MNAATAAGSAGNALRPCSAHHARKMAKSLPQARFVGRTLFILGLGSIVRNDGIDGYRLRRAPRLEPMASTSF